MRRIATAAAGLLAALALAACGSGDVGGTTNEVSVATAEGQPSGELTISNWPLYIDKKTIPEFEDQSGVSVKYIEDINSYDEFFGKMHRVRRATTVAGGQHFSARAPALEHRLAELHKFAVEGGDFREDFGEFSDGRGKN